MFIGISSLSIDAKGRVAIPKNHRDRLAAEGISEMVVTADPERCLLIVGKPEWKVIQEKLASAPNLDQKVRAYLRMYLGHATWVEFDSNGRILLPAELRNWAGIERKGVMLGLGRKLELWSDTRFAENSGDWSDTILDNKANPEVPEALRDLSI